MQDQHGMRINAGALVQWLFYNTKATDQLLVMAPKGDERSELMVWDDEQGKPSVRIEIPVFTLDRTFYHPTTDEDLAHHQRQAERLHGQPSATEIDALMSLGKEA